MARLLYFAWLRERIGLGEEMVALPDDVRTVEGLIDLLVAREGGYAAAFARRERLRCAVNQVMATLQTAVAAADEVAFFPPITGG